MQTDCPENAFIVFVPTFRIRIVHFILTHTYIHTGGEALSTLLFNPDTPSRSVIFLFLILFSPENLRDLLKINVFESKFCLHEVNAFLNLDC